MRKKTRMVTPNTMMGKAISRLPIKRRRLFTTSSFRAFVGSDPCAEPACLAGFRPVLLRNGPHRSEAIRAVFDYSAEHASCARVLRSDYAVAAASSRFRPVVLMGLKPVTMDS